MVKATGLEFKRFYTDDKYWPQDDGNTYHEDEYVRVDGAPWETDYEKISDDAKVEIDGGIVFGPQWDENEPSFEAYFKRWRKAQTTIFFTVEAPIVKADAIKEAIKAAGGKVA